MDRQGTQARHQLWRVPSTDPDVLMFTTVFRPSGSGPFPLIVMNHEPHRMPSNGNIFPCSNSKRLRSVDYMTTQSFVRSEHVVVMGQSAGGWDTLAFVSENPSDVRAAINFDGGRGGHFQGRPNHNCRADQLVDATRVLGRTARTPMLWIYTENDSYFGPQLSKQMF